MYGFKPQQEFEVTKKLYKALTIILVIVSLYSFGRTKGYAEEKEVYLGGMTAGFIIDNEGATVIGVNDITTINGMRAPAGDAGIKTGDILISLDGKTVNGAKDIASVLSVYDGNGITAVFERDGEIILKILYPEKDLSGEYKLGLFIRDEFTGIGTITYVEEDGTFGALGHPVSDKGKGKPIKINGGKMYLCTVMGVTKGVRGKAGEIRGLFDGSEVIGNVKSNTAKGIFGKIVPDIKDSLTEKAAIDDPKPGNAEILCTIEGNTVERFSACIIKAVSTAPENKNIVIKITDKVLIEKTGGILQGMSGSPILQDGKLVGAITHVFLNDPEKGFGISIKNMMAG